MELTGGTLTPSQKTMDKFFPSIFHDLHKHEVKFVSIEPSKVEFDYNGYSFSLELKQITK